ncbi:MAG: AIR synthase related protein, partial [Candidatus Nanopelagicales bacterium]
GNGRFAQLDPYAGAQLAFAEAYRNVAVTGAEPLAVTNCLNFGSPEDPDVMWQFSQAVQGLADACLEMGTPVTGGNVSFYNQTGDVAIHPTPVVGVLGVIDDVRRRTPMAFGVSGEQVFLLGLTRDELAGSEWAHVVHAHLGGLPPQVSLAAERALADVLVRGCRDRVLSAAHDVSGGGVAQTLVEMALRGDTGAMITVPPDLDPFVFLYSESTARAVVVVAPERADELLELCRPGGVPVTSIGTVVADSASLTIETAYDESVTWPLAQLRAAAEATLPALFA